MHGELETDLEVVGVKIAVSRDRLINCCFIFARLKPVFGENIGEILQNWRESDSPGALLNLDKIV